MADSHLESPNQVVALARAVREKAVSVCELTARTTAMLQTSSYLNATIDLISEHAAHRSAEIDHAIGHDGVAATSQFGALIGVPVAIKDNLCFGSDVAGSACGRTTCGSRILENYSSPYTATSVKRLIDAGAVVVAKTNMDEFGMGSSGEHSAFGPTRNPWDPERVPGGSSSGSAALVAAGVVPAALGSDTGGSIRQPAGFCNLVGVKPTHGRVSRYGLVAYASSLDQVGVLTRTVTDAAQVLQVISGADSNDVTSLCSAVPDYSADLERGIEDLVIGIPIEARSASNHPAVRASLENAAFVYRSLGATIIDIELPHIEHAIAAYYIIATAEASSNLARFDGIRYGRRAELSPSDGLVDAYARSRAEGLGTEVKRRIMLGTYVLSSGYYDAYYNAALRTRRLIKQDYDAAFRRGVHAILMPTSPSPAFRLGEKQSDPMALYLEDVYTVGVNLAGLPAIAVPGGFAAVGDTGMDDANHAHDADAAGPLLPVGLQLIGPALSERELLRIARMFERETEYWKRRPKLWYA